MLRTLACPLPLGTSIAAQRPRETLPLFDSRCPTFVIQQTTS